MGLPNDAEAEGLRATDGSSRSVQLIIFNDKILNLNQLNVKHWELGNYVFVLLMSTEDLLETC